MSALSYDHGLPGRCPACASHGVVSRQVGTEIRPNVYTYEQRDVPCAWCTGGTGTREYTGRWES